jgi:hypothetical protein
MLLLTVATTMLRLRAVEELPVHPWIGRCRWQHLLDD